MRSQLDSGIAGTFAAFLRWPNMSPQSTPLPHHKSTYNDSTSRMRATQGTHAYIVLHTSVTQSHTHTHTHTHTQTHRAALTHDSNAGPRCNDTTGHGQIENSLKYKVEIGLELFRQQHSRLLLDMLSKLQYTCISNSGPETHTSIRERPQREMQLDSKCLCTEKNCDAGSDLPRNCTAKRLATKSSARVFLWSGVRAGPGGDSVVKRRAGSIYLFLSRTYLMRRYLIALETHAKPTVGPSLILRIHTHTHTHTHNTYTHTQTHTHTHTHTHRHNTRTHKHTITHTLIHTHTH